MKLEIQTELGDAIALKLRKLCKATDLAGSSLSLQSFRLRVVRLFRHDLNVFGGSPADRLLLSKSIFSKLLNFWNLKSLKLVGLLLSMVNAK